MPAGMSSGGWWHKYVMAYLLGLQFLVNAIPQALTYFMAYDILCA